METSNLSTLTMQNNNEQMETEVFHESAINDDIDGADMSPDFLNEDDSDEDDFVVTIGEIKANVPFQKQHRSGGGTSGTIDLDANPTLKDGTPIYDLDLATMEDKPWRKPGADLTDYFNYGFNEETWNHYCERQRKFRQEFGTDQSAINKAILSNIQLSGPAQIGLTTFAGGRQLVNLAGGTQESKQQQNKTQKIVVDLSKPPPLVNSSTGGDFSANPIPLIRTVINESGIVTRRESTSDLNSSFPIENAEALHHDSATTPEAVPLSKTPPIASNVSNIIIDFSKPPPNFDPAIPPPLLPAVSQVGTMSRAQAFPSSQVSTVGSMSMTQTAKIASIPTNVDLPPGVEEVEGPPGVVEIEMPPPGIPRMDFSQPPPTSQFPYNPPASFGPSSSTFAPPGLQLEQRTFSHSRPIPLFQSSFRHPFGGFSGRFHDRFKGGRGISRTEDRNSADSDGESNSTHRKRHRSRSRSRSLSPRRRHKEAKHKDRERKEKDGKKKKDKEKKEKDKHRTRRSPSVKKERQIKNERRSNEREKEEKEPTSRRRASDKVKIERKSPE